MVLSPLTSLLRNLLDKQRQERELDQEVRTDELLLADEKIRAGTSPREAHRQARLELGGVEQVKEQVREMRGGNCLKRSGKICASAGACCERISRLP
ncbi:MAG: hypothetical protein HRJ53_11445, partial [Acidobacteria bacterium Pan2503]|nr:hypothetical protein [Candidatus Acidoferrum panamensis]